MLFYMLPLSARSTVYQGTTGKCIALIFSNAIGRILTWGLPRCAGVGHVA